MTKEVARGAWRGRTHLVHLADTKQAIDAVRKVLEVLQRFGRLAQASKLMQPILAIGT
jgi:hypothetical protein